MGLSIAASLSRRRGVDPRPGSLGQALVALVVPRGASAPRRRSSFFAVLIVEVGPGRALVITYVAPVVALALGVSDPRRASRARAPIAGLLLILAGSWLSTYGRVPPGLAAVVTRWRARRTERVVERRSHPMNALGAWTSYWTTAADSRSSTASGCSRR